MIQVISFLKVFVKFRDIISSLYCISGFYILWNPKYKLFTKYSFYIKNIFKLSFFVVNANSGIAFVIFFVAHKTKCFLGNVKLNA